MKAYGAVYKGSTDDYVRCISLDKQSVMTKMVQAHQIGWPELQKRWKIVRVEVKVFQGEDDVDSECTSE